MWHVYVYSFLAGVVGANGLPHFLKGLSGKSNQTPFGKNSLAYVNLVWGWLSLVVAALLIYYSHFHDHMLRAFGMVALGALFIGLVLATSLSAQHPTKK